MEVVTWDRSWSTNQNKNKNKKKSTSISWKGKQSTLIILISLIRSGNNVIFDKPFVLNSSQTVGDSSCILQDRVCIKKLVCV